jgi:hypothetical protein
MQTCVRVAVAAESNDAEKEITAKNKNSEPSARLLMILLAGQSAETDPPRYDQTKMDPCQIRYIGRISVISDSYNIQA